MVNKVKGFDGHEDIHDMVIYEIKEKFNKEVNLLNDLEKTLITNRDIVSIVDNLTEDKYDRLKNIIEVISRLIEQKVKFNDFLKEKAIYFGIEEIFAQRENEYDLWDMLYENKGLDYRNIDDIFLRSFQVRYIIDEVKKRLFSKRKSGLKEGIKLFYARRENEYIKGLCNFKYEEYIDELWPKYVFKYYKSVLQKIGKQH